MAFVPRLEPVEHDGLRLLEDRAARRRGVLVAFTDRRGGVSAAPYDTLNLAERSGDERACVDVNRRRAARAAGFEVGALALARQVHGAHVIEAAPGRSGILGEADGLLVRRTGPVAGILTADCAPVIVAGEDGVALLHAGWRGLVAGVIERGVDLLDGPWAAWVGPAIRACCYEVRADVIEAFEGAGLPVVDDGRVDPPDAARAALVRAGVDAVAVAGECTACSPRFFSYRRDGITGRQGAFAALLPTT
ncbi:MAG: polyphenol oxidase family protein [Actinomycetota bacterium]